MRIVKRVVLTGIIFMSIMLSGTDICVSGTHICVSQTE
jgi:hypothetical protein